MKYFLVLVSLVFSTFSHANYYCTGKVSHLGLSGSLNVSNGFGVHVLCPLTEEKCKAWSSLVMAAKMADKSISIYYSSTSPQGGNQNNGACNNIGSWVTPADPVYYIQLN